MNPARSILKGAGLGSLVGAIVFLLVQTALVPRMFSVDPELRNVLHNVAMLIGAGVGAVVGTLVVLGTLLEGRDRERP